MQGCAACEDMDEVLKQALKHHDNLIIETIDIALEPEIAQEYNIRNIPTVQMYYEGNLEPEYHMVGLSDLEFINKRINSLK